MDGTLKIASTLIVSLFGLTIYTLHRPLFYLSIPMNILIFLIAGIISTTTIYLMGCSYEKTIILKNIKQQEQGKSIYRAINVRLALLFSIVMLVTNFLCSVAIFSFSERILKSCFEFSNLFSSISESQKVMRIFITSIILAIVAFILVLPEKYKRRLEQLNTIIIPLFCIFLIVLFFIKTPNKEKVEINEERLENSKFKKKDMISAIFYVFSCQHIAISTFSRMKDMNHQVLFKICSIFFIIGVSGILLISYLGCEIVRNCKEFDTKPFDTLFLENLCDRMSSFHTNLQHKGSAIIQKITIFFVLCMNYLLIYNIATLIEVVLNALYELCSIILDVIPFKLESKIGKVEKNEFLENQFVHKMIISVLIIVFSLFLDPNVLLKYLSIVSGNLIILIIPPLMYFLVTRKLDTIVDENIIDSLATKNNNHYGRDAMYYLSISMMVLGVASIAVFMLI